MKKLYSNYLLTFLVFLLMFSVVAQPVEATNDAGADSGNTASPEVQDFVDQTSELLSQYSEPEQAAAEVYRSLTPRAKEILFADLKRQETKGDTELVEMYKSFMDEAAKMQYANTSSQPEVIAAASALSVLSNELVALKLPLVVRSTLYGVGAGISAAVADGPLPIGDIIAGVAGVAAAVAIGVYWDEVSSKWDGIVNAFKKAFTSIKNDVEFVIYSLAARIISRTITVKFPTTVDGKAERHMSKSLVQDLVRNINNNRTSGNNLEIYMNASFALMGVYDVKTNIKGRASRHLGDSQSNPKHTEYVDNYFNMSGYTLFISYNWKTQEVFHAHFTPTWLRTRELTYNRYQYQYVWRIYPSFSYNDRYSKTKNRNYDIERVAAMGNRGLKQDSRGKTSVVPLK